MRQEIEQSGTSVISEKRMHEQIALCLHIRKIFEKWRARKDSNL
jgi:hypothetical protein